MNYLSDVDEDYTKRLNNHVWNSMYGFFIEWEELKKLSLMDKFPYELILVGTKGERDIRRNMMDDFTLFAHSEIYIQLVDQFWWRVYAENYDLIEQLNKFYPGDTVDINGYKY